MTLITRARTEDKEDFIYVPSMGIYVAKERSHLGKNWHKAHQALLEEDSRMLTIPEFVNFLNYVKENNTQIYNDITQVRNPWRAEWLDAYFKKRKDGLYILTGNKANAEKLEPPLMKHRRLGIFLDSWLKNPTSQGLPRLDVLEGNLYYWYPKEDGEVAAGFVTGLFRAGLSCHWNPSSRDSDLGVRAAKQRK